jgi:hypothetical protein
MCWRDRLESSFLRGASRSTISGASETNGKKLLAVATIRVNKPSSAANWRPISDGHEPLKALLDRRGGRPQQISGEFNITNYRGIAGASRDEWDRPRRAVRVRTSASDRPVQPAIVTLKTRGTRCQA